MMIRSLLALALVVLFVAPAAAQIMADEDLDTVASRLDRLADDIQLLEELNTLQLTEVQLEALETEVAALGVTTAPIIATRVSALQQLEPLLQEKRQALVLNQQPSADLLDRIGKIEEQLDGLDEQMDKAILALAPRLRQILSEPQISIVSGEEDARRQVVMLIEVIRDMDAERFNRDAPGYAADLERLDKGLSAQTIMNLFTTARNLTPEEYQTAQSEVVDGLMSIYAPSAEVADAMMAYFFGEPEMHGLLKDKLNR